MRRKAIFAVLGSGCLVLILVALPFMTAWAKTVAPAKENIKIGFSIPLSGVFAAGADSQMKAQRLWSEIVNERGGIYVKDIGNRLPVKLAYYDDKSSTEDAIKIYERLITVDKVDLLLPPWGTQLCVSLIPTMERHKIPWVAGTCGGMDFKKARGLKYSWVLDFLSSETAASVVDVLSAHKDHINTVAVIYAHVDFTVENERFFVPAAKEAGFEIILDKDYPMGVSDLSGVLMEVKRKNPDAFIAFTYPADCFLVIKQAMEVGLNPKLFYSAVGPGCSAFPDIFGPATNGICTQGTWSQKLPWPGAKEFYDNYVKRWNCAPDYLDSVLSYQVCQIMEQAVEKAGTLDLEKIRDVIATEKFTTIDGPIKFSGEVTNTLARRGLLQWQEGEVEAIWPPEKSTAELLIPKPSWPK
jgi:branched-chain amino acid transport system substrate-binding protein